jgi:hypothetical protein
MVSDDPNVITVEGDDDSYQRDSGVATGTISPGQILERNGTSSSGATDETQVQRNSSDGAVLVPRIALELAKTGKTIDDDYADGDYTEWRVFESGDVAYLPIFDGDNAAGTGTDTSDNANVSEDDYLVPYSGSGEDGNFRAFDSADGDTEGQKMFQALGAVDNSGGTSPAYIRAEKV